MSGSSSPAADATATTFVAQLDRLVQDLWAWSPSRFTAARQRLLHVLALDWARIARDAGVGAPPDAVPPVLEAHGIADQLAVLGQDVLRAPDAERAATEALSRLVAARAALG